MTTLKQILQKHCDMPIYYRYQNEINAVKEWLQQKRKEIGEKHIKIPIDELLEELK